jgi:hypothetical protein
VGLWFTWWRKLPSAQVAEQERGGMEL